MSRTTVGLVLALVVAGSFVPFAEAAEAPRIVSKRFRFIVRSYQPYRLFVEARFRVCDDSPGRLRAVVRQQKRISKSYPPLAAAGFAKSLPAPAACRAYRLEWRLASKFFGVGWYIVNLRVRDDEGFLSNAVGRAWFTSD